MKVYFEDGRLIPFNPEIAHCEFTIDAANGVSFCQNRLDICSKYYPGCAIYTNSLMALNNRYIGNEELRVPELYLRNRETLKFERADKLTDKEIRQPHNLMQMYLNGAFDSYIEYPD